MQSSLVATSDLPRVAVERGAQPDPRVALFTHSIEYTPVEVSFESSYEAIGRFLWRLRELPTTIEIGSMEIVRGLPLMRMRLTLFVYRRTQSSTGVTLPAPAALPRPALPDSLRRPNPVVPRTASADPAGRQFSDGALHQPAGSRPGP